jgi:hypothetical protein
MLFVPPHALVSGGMSDNNIPKPRFSNFVYSPHYYDGMVILFNTWQGTSPEDTLEKLRDKAEQWQVPMILSEFGGPADAGNIEAYVTANYDWLDEHFVSGTQWCYTPGWRDDVKDGWNTEDFSIVDDSGALRRNFTPRPYPQKIAGIPQVFAQNDAGFSLGWIQDASSGNTEVYIPAGFADDKSVNISLPEGVSGKCELEERLIVCAVDGPGAVTLTLAR